MKNNILVLILTLIFITGVITYLENEKTVPTENVPGKEVINVANKSSIAMKEEKYPKAKELESPQGYFNIDNITLKDQIGKKVILIDFWTYSCINCQRTLPYLNAWYEKYKDQGFLIIGVHTPEFDFEKEYQNVKKAIEEYHIQYPVIQDNDYTTWRSYGNRYWPRKYLIDIDGFIVYDHIGEGGYEETELMIQKALAEKNQRMNQDQTLANAFVKPNVSSPEFLDIQTPEIYFGYGFSRNQMGNSEGYLPDKTVNYTLPTELMKNKFYLQGAWLNTKDHIESMSNGEIHLHYHAKDIHIVTGSDNSMNITVSIDNHVIKNITISGYGLYPLYSGANYEDYMVRIMAPQGLKVFTFTFG